MFLRSFTISCPHLGNEEDFDFKQRKKTKQTKNEEKERKKKKNHAHITIVEVYGHSDLTDIILPALAVQEE